MIRRGARRRQRPEAAPESPVHERTFMRLGELSLVQEPASG
jgi:hypothetical protein